jgi:hypothetical protein
VFEFENTEPWARNAAGGMVMQQTNVECSRHNVVIVNSRGVLVEISALTEFDWNLFACATNTSSIRQMSMLRRTCVMTLRDTNVGQ